LISRKRPFTTGQKKQSSAPCFRQNKPKACQCLQALFTLWLPWKTQQIHGHNCFTNSGKNKTFLLNQNVACAKYGICMATCVICNRQYVGQVFQEMVSTARYLEQTGWEELQKASRGTTHYPITS